MRNRSLSIILGSAFAFCMHPSVLPAQNINIDEQRSQAIKEMAATDIPDPKKIEEMSVKIFALPLDQQSEDDLRVIAKRANEYANFVGHLEKQYQSYQRENYRYDFVVKEVEPIQNKYIIISNKYKDIRNKSYYNLAEKARERGDIISAFFYYNDVYRLSDFECNFKSIDSCLRRRAEIQMQKLLKITEVTPYTTWQKK